MNLALIGVNHKTAPVGIRERLAFAEATLPAALERLKSVDGVREGLILSTCNRVEVIVNGEPDAEVNGRLPGFLSSYHGVALGDLVPHLYEHRQNAAVRHIFRVAASLDSMMVGEPQILGQVKTAYAAARAAHSVGGPLEEVLMRAFAVAKKVRTETGIAQSAVSVSYAAVELARKIFGSLQGKAVMLIGAGKMSELSAKHLLHSGASSLLIANRNFDRAVQMSEHLQGKAVRFEDLLETLPQADIVISSTGAPHFILKKEDGAKILSRRRNRPMFFIDIAVPRDIDPDLNKLDNIFVYDIDDLHEVINANLAERTREAELGEKIVEHEVEQFLDRIKSLEVVPTIVSLQERLEEIRRQEIERLHGRLGNLTPEQAAAVEQLTRGIINKVLHQPIAQMKEGARQADGLKLVDAVRRMFNLK